MNICIIGTSHIAERFTRAAALVGGAKLYSVCSRSFSTGKVFAEKHGIDVVYEGLDSALVDGAIDAYYVASPNYAHFEQAKKCLEAGKHVLCEKPACVSLTQLDALYEIAEKNNLVFLEAMMPAHCPGRKALKDSIKRVGRISTVQLDFSQRSSRLDALNRGEKPNIFNPELCAGGLMDLGCYPISVAVDLFGRPAGVKSDVRFLDTGADVSGTVLLDYEGFVVTITYSKAANGFIGSRICGDDGAILIDSVSKLSKIRFISNGGEEVTIHAQPSDDEVMSAEVADFIDYASVKRADDLLRCREVTRAVCEILQEVRRQNDFQF